MSKKMPEIDMADSTKVWQSKVLQKKIRDLYKKVAKDLAKEAANLLKDGGLDEKLKKAFLTKYIKSIEKEIDNLEKLIYKETKVSMNITAKAVVDANIKFMERLNINFEGAFDKVPDKVVKNLLNGSVYKNDWDFSKAIWQSTKKTKKDMYAIVAEGAAKQKPTYDIAKDLEKYLNPMAKKPWDWSKVYPGVTTKVDYNAQRLARTLLQHAYQQAFKQTVQYNPFITGVIWRSVFAAGRTCQLCMDRDGQRFNKGTEPLDHPMGLCYLEPEIPKNMEEIAKDLSDWAHGESNPDIDKYMKHAFNNDTAKYYKAKNSAKYSKPLKYKGKTKDPAKLIIPK